MSPNFTSHDGILGDRPHERRFTYDPSKIMATCCALPDVEPYLQRDEAQTDLMWSSLRFRKYNPR